MTLPPPIHFVLSQIPDLHIFSVQSGGTMTNGSQRKDLWAFIRAQFSCAQKYQKSKIQFVYVDNVYGEPVFICYGVADKIA